MAAKVVTESAIRVAHTVTSVPTEGNRKPWEEVVVEDVLRLFLRLPPVVREVVFVGVGTVDVVFIRRRSEGGT